MTQTKRKKRVVLGVGPIHWHKYYSSKDGREYISFNNSTKLGRELIRNSYFKMSGLKDGMRVRLIAEIL